MTAPYPLSFDVVWLASDRHGCLGAFVTGGVGPVPVVALTPAPGDPEDIELRLLELPVMAEAKLSASTPLPESFAALVERGLFVYDWTDVHRTRSTQRNAYQRFAVPTRAITVDALPEDIAAVARRVCLAGTDFGADEAIDVTLQLSCERGE